MGNCLNILSASRGDTEKEANLTNVSPITKQRPLRRASTHSAIDTINETRHSHTPSSEDSLRGNKQKSIILIQI